MTAMDMAPLKAMLATFIDGRDRSTTLAAAIEVALDETFGDREPFASASLDLASYRPGGGELLYDEQRMMSILWGVLEAIKRAEATP